MYHGAQLATKANDFVYGGKQFGFPLNDQNPFINGVLHPLPARAFNPFNVSNY